MGDIATTFILNPGYCSGANKMLCVLTYLAGSSRMLIRLNFGTEHIFDVICRDVVSALKHLYGSVDIKEHRRIKAFGIDSSSPDKMHGTPYNVCHRQAACKLRKKGDTVAAALVHGNVSLLEGTSSNH